MDKKSTWGTSRVMAAAVAGLFTVGSGAIAQAPPGFQFAPTLRRGQKPPPNFQTFTPPPGFPAPSAGSTYTFDFRGADIDNVLKFFSQISNMTVTKDPALTGPVTILSPHPVTLDEAFRVLQSVLAVRGFTALQEGNVLSVVPIDRAVANTTLMNGNPLAIARNQVMTEVIPLENVDADSLAKELAPALISKGASLIGSPETNALIITDTASNVHRFQQLVQALDKAFNTAELRVFPLKRAESTVVAELVNNLYKQLTSRGKAPAGSNPTLAAVPTAANPFPQPLFTPAVPAGQPGRGAVVAVADTRLNTVIVVASAENLAKVADLIGKLDDDDASAMTTKIRKLHFADADKIATLINTVLSNQHASAAAGAGGSQQNAAAPFQQRAFGAFGIDLSQPGAGQPQAASTDPFGKVAADPRTNSLLVTANADRMSEIDGLIDELDVKVEAETTTFVVPLKNAQADDVAFALNQAFSTTAEQYVSNKQQGNINETTNGQGRQKINRKLGTSSSSPGATNAAPPAPPPAPDPAPTPDPQSSGDGALSAATPAVSAEDAAKVKEVTRQIPFSAFAAGGGQQGSPQTHSQTYGRGLNGSYVNLLQMKGNVVVTPAPGGDAVIVTTSPDNYVEVKRLIEELDVVARQVMIEVIVAEATLNNDNNVGFVLGGNFTNLFGKTNTAQGQIGLPATGFGTTYNSTATAGQFTISAGNYSALIQALTTDSKVRVISTPRVFTSNNQEAEIDITEQIPYITGQAASSLVSTTVSNQVEFLNVGFILNVTPRITRQGLVTIDLQQEASDLLNFMTLGTGVSAIQAPVVNDRYADTSVTVQDGETAVIGGLIHNSITTTDNSIPFLSQIPLLGQLFRSHEVSKNKVELMIFLTPHVINSPEEARRLTAQEGGQVLNQLRDLPKVQPNLDPTKPKPPLSSGQ